MSAMPVVFDFGNLNVRVVQDENGEPWFVATDIAGALEFRDAYNAVRSLDDDEKGTHTVSTPGGAQRLATINESGLFALIIRSNKPRAKQFRKWVTAEVLPALRRNGRYEVPEAAVVDQPPVNVPFEIQVAESAARMLRMSETSKIRMLTTLCEEKGISSAFLPSYVDEELTAALGDLLKKHGSKLSARAANQFLISMGLVEELERRASRGGVKRFKSLTGAGLAFGKNETCPRNPSETQPRYFVKTFPRLLDLISAWMHSDSEAA